jgi:polysaccharide deacetylase family protein (PEP-CTERM system associated)
MSAPVDVVAAEARQPALSRPPLAIADSAGDSRVMNAMSVDVEDFFQVQAFAGQIDRKDWDSFPCRVERNVDLILALFSRHKVAATFFVLGWVAERYPSLVRRIIAEGHELASHGCNHYRVTEQSPSEFRADVRRAKALLQDIGGQPIKGYRAPSFSIGTSTVWALDVLAEEGYSYSSSIYPIAHDLYGMPDAPRFSYRPRGDQFVEIPMTTLRAFGRNFPCSGGGYFRLFPYVVSRWAMRQVNRSEGRSCVFYFHPWEVDPEQPRPSGAPLKSRVRHYINLGRMEARLGRLLSDFRWDRMDRVFFDDDRPRC